MSAVIDRQLNIADYALGGFARRLGRNLSLVCIFALVIFLVASLALTATSLRESAARLLDTVPDITVQQMAAGRQVGLELEAIGRIGGIFGIRSIRPRIWGYYFDEATGANYTVIGHPGLGARARLPGLGIDYQDDGPSDPVHAEAVLGRGVRTALGLEGRRAFSLFRPDLSLKSFVLAGTFADQTAMISDDLIVMDLEAARDLFAIPPGQVTDLLVEVHNPLETDTIAEKISAGLDNVRVITRERIAKTYRAAFGWRSGIGQACLIGALAAFFILAWDKATGLTPEQRREVAILRVLGWQTEDVITLRFWESFIVSSLAFGFGYLGAWAHLLFFDGCLFRPLLLGWSVVRPPLTLTPVFDFGDLLLIFSLSVLPYLAATVIPAWHSATIRPEAVI